MHDFGAAPLELRRLIDALPALVAAISADRRYIYVNRAYAEWFGSRPIVGRTVADVVGPVAYAKVEPMIARVLRGEQFSFEQQLDYAEGTREVRVDYAPRIMADGAQDGFYALVRDVSEARAAERALAESEARLRFLDELGQAVAGEPDADAILGITTRMVAEHLGVSNCAYADMDADEDGFTIRGDWAAPGSPSIVGHYSLADFGRLAVQELSARRPLIINDNLRELAPEEAKTFQDIGIAATICMPLVKAGRLTALMAIHDRKPHVWSAYELALITEVTERSWAHVERVRSEAELRRLNASLEARVEDEVSRRTEAQAALLQSQKMETVGQLTGGVAHDFNNLLTPIVGALEIAHRRAGEDERLRTLTAGGLQAADRARTLVQRLLAFSRRQHLEPRPVDIEGLVEGMRDLIARSLGPDIELVMKAETGLRVLVDPNQLELALLNLAVNARDAMPDGGRLTFEAWRGRRHPTGDPDWVHIAVTDTGLGMDPAVLARAVEPFYTTKEVGKGTGLGLSSVQGLALQSGGEFTLESTPGEGVVATLGFPALEAGAQRPTAPAPSGPASERLDGLTVLLVDDEELVRSATAAMLSEAGASVVEAKSALTALAMLRQGVVPDLLVTDYAMPGMNGAALAREVGAERPDLPILMITGYADISDASGGLPRLSKPFTEAQLTAAVADLRAGGGVQRPEGAVPSRSADACCGPRNASRPTGL